MTTNPSDGSPAAVRSDAREPAEGRDDLGIPGADRGDPPTGPSGGGAVDEEERRDALAERTRAGHPTPAAEHGDVLPDVEVPEHQM